MQPGLELERDLDAALARRRLQTVSLAGAEPTLHPLQPVYVELPQLVDVKDLSTEDVRIALEMKKDADEKMIMAYLFKHTPLQISIAVNLTCLIPTENPLVGRSERLELHDIRVVGLPLGEEGRQLALPVSQNGF